MSTTPNNIDVRAYFAAQVMADNFKRLREEAEQVVKAALAQAPGLSFDDRMAVLESDEIVELLENARTRAARQSVAEADALIAALAEGGAS